MSEIQAHTRRSLAPGRRWNVHPWRDKDRDIRLSKEKRVVWIGSARNRETGAQNHVARGDLEHRVNAPLVGEQLPRLPAAAEGRWVHHQEVDVDHQRDNGLRPRSEQLFPDARSSRPRGSAATVTRAWAGRASGAKLP